MNTFSSQSQTQTKAQTQSAALALTRAIPGVMRAASLRQDQRPQPQTQAVVELTIGKDPQTLVSEAVAKVRHPGLHSLLASFTNEPEIRQVLYQMEEHPNAACVHQVRGDWFSCQSFPSWPIQRLRRAGELAQHLCAFGREEREVLYAATVLQGCKDLLITTMGAVDGANVHFTLVRKGLHQMDDLHPRQAWLLRQCMGWGIEDEVDDFYVPRLQQSVKRSLSLVAVQLAGMKLPFGSSGPAHHPDIRH